MLNMVPLVGVQSTLIQCLLRKAALLPSLSVLTTLFANSNIDTWFDYHLHFITFKGLDNQYVSAATDTAPYCAIL